MKDVSTSQSPITTHRSPVTNTEINMRKIIRLAFFAAFILLCTADHAQAHSVSLAWTGAADPRGSAHYGEPINFITYTCVGRPGQCQTYLMCIRFARGSTQNQ